MNGKRKRALTQFRLRTPLLLMALLAVPLGIWKVYLAPYLTQHRDLIALRQAGAAIQTELTMPSGWITKLDPLGSDRYHEAIEVDLGQQDFEPSMLKHLFSLRKLKTLKLRGAKFQLEHLRQLRKLPALRVVRLNSTSISYAQFVEAETWFPQAELELSQEWDVAKMSNAGGWFQGIGFPLSRPVAVQTDSGFGFRSGRGLPPDYDAASSVVLPFRKWFADRLPYLYFVEDLRLRQGGWNLEALSRMPRLRQLSLLGVGLADLDTRPLANIKGLVSVDLSNTGVGDETLRQLRHCKQLRRLRLSHTRITDEGLKYVGELTDLVELMLTGNKITNVGVGRLRNLTNLEVLSLRMTRIDGAAMQHLANMKRLQTLNLNQTGISDEGAAKLAPLKSLKWLDLSRTAITRQAAAALDKQLPLNPIVR